MADSILAREYLKSRGAKDNEIDYSNGAVTYKNKPFFQTSINADGRAYGSQGDLAAAYKAYQGNDALDQYKTNITKPVTPFTYDMNSVKENPLYTSQLNSFTQDTNRGTDTALVNLGRRGIGNSSNAVQAELSGQKSIDDYANNKLAPTVIGQLYQQYLDQQNQQDKQNQNLLGLSNVYDQQNQQDFNNNLATNQDNRAQAAQDANFTGYYNDPNTSAIRKAMDSNSAAYGSSSPKEQKRLHDENVKLAASIGGMDTTGNGDYSFGQGKRTLQGQQMDYQKARDAISDERYKQKFDQDAKQWGLEFALKQAVESGQLKISQQNADTSAFNAGRSASSDNLSALYKQWEATGTAPAGIHGVAQGTPLYDKTGARQDQQSQNKQEQLDAKSFTSERDGMVSAIRANKVNVNDAMSQINQDEQMGVYTPDLAEKLRAVVRVLAGKTKVTTDPQNNIQVDLSGYGNGGGGSSVTGNVFGK